MAVLVTALGVAAEVARLVRPYPRGLMERTTAGAGESARPSGGTARATQPVERPGAPAWVLVRLALWLGLAYGLAEGVEAVLLGRIPGVLSWRSGNAAPVLWVAPLVYGAAFTVLALPIVGLARLVRSVPWHVVLVFGLLWLGAYLGASLPGQGLSRVACAVLGLGLATELTRRYRAHRAQAEVVTARTLRVLLGVVAAVALIVSVAGWAGERWAVHALPAAPTGRPNVLLLVMDAERADHLSSYGYTRPTTPHLDAIAAGEGGMLFERAWANSSWTLPSHATMMTGRSPREHRAGQIRRPWLDGRYPTLAEELRRAGYATGGFVANTYWCGRQTRLNRGFIHYEDFYGTLGDALARTSLGRQLGYDVLPRFGLVDIPGRKRATVVNRELLRWVDGLGGRPFFAFVNYLDVHGPFLPPAPYEGRFSAPRSAVHRSGRIELDAINAETRVPPPARLRQLVDAYDESLAYLDAEIGALLDTLDQRGMLRNTLVIITGDHGESFGEHGLIYHGSSLYRDQTQVPLILRVPRAGTAGRRAWAAVGVNQIPATVAAVTGLPARLFPGRSLLDEGGGGTRGEWNQGEESAPVLQEVGRRSLVASWWPTSRTSLAALVTERWQFIEPDSGATELYDLAADPGEVRNLASAPAQALRVAQFRSRLRSALRGSSGVAVAVRQAAGARR